uniref:Uncharacterized protein n=1 Tax=Setaria italica TaxID=4555 RepID=K4ANP3_SETIT
MLVMRRRVKFQWNIWHVLAATQIVWSVTTASLISVGL